MLYRDAQWPKAGVALLAKTKTSFGAVWRNPRGDSLKFFV